MAKPTIIQVQVNMKLSKEQIEFAARETERLYKLVEGGGSSTEWAIRRIEHIQNMMLFPDLGSVSNEIKNKLRLVDESTVNATVVTSPTNGNGGTPVNDVG